MEIRSNLLYKGKIRSNLLYKGKIRSNLLYKGKIRSNLLYKGKIPCPRSQWKFHKTTGESGLGKSFFHTIKSSRKSHNTIFFRKYHNTVPLSLNFSNFRLFSLKWYTVLGINIKQCLWVWFTVQYIYGINWKLYSMVVEAERL